MAMREDSSQCLTYPGHSATRSTLRRAHPWTEVGDFTARYGPRRCVRRGIFLTSQRHPRPTSAPSRRFPHGPVRFESFSFGSIRIDGVTYDYDLVIDRAEIRTRQKRVSKE